MKEKRVRSILLFLFLTLVVGNNLKAAEEENSRKIQLKNAPPHIKELLSLASKNHPEFRFSDKELAELIEENKKERQKNKEANKKFQQDTFDLIAKASDFSVAANLEKLYKNLDLLGKESFGENLDCLTEKYASTPSEEWQKDADSLFEKELSGEELKEAILSLAKKRFDDFNDQISKECDEEVWSSKSKKD